MDSTAVVPALYKYLLCMLVNLRTTQPHLWGISRIAGTVRYKQYFSIIDLDNRLTVEATKSSQSRWKKCVPGRLCSAPVLALYVSSPDRKHWLAEIKNPHLVEALARWN
jgi:hypothetical protein